MPEKRKRTQSLLPSRKSARGSVLLTPARSEVELSGAAMPGSVRGEKETALDSMVAPAVPSTPAEPVRAWRAELGLTVVDMIMH